MRKRFTTEQIRFTDEQIIGILLAEIGAMSIKVLCKKHDLTEQTFSAGATSSATWMYPRPRARERLAEAGGGRADAGHRRVEGDHPKKRPHRNDVARFRCWFIVVSRSVRPVDTVA